MRRPDKLIQKIKDKHPKLSKKATHSMKAAIKLHCLECSNNEQELVEGCSADECFLWPHRLKAEWEVSYDE